MVDNLETTDHQMLRFEFVFIDTQMNMRDCYECVRNHTLNNQGVPNGFYIKKFVQVEECII